MILDKTKKYPKGDFHRQGGWGDDVILIVRGPNMGYSGFGFIGRHSDGKMYAMIWPNQDNIKYSDPYGERTGDYSRGKYHEEPAENCQVIVYGG